MHKHGPRTAFPYRGVLFVCRGNAVRSQMAEGLFRAVAPDGVKVWSAGQHPIGLARQSVDVMREIGIDISHQRSKGIAEVPLDDIDLIIVLCGGQDDPCPSVPPAIARLHWPLPDPYLAAPTGSGGMDGFRAVRDDLREKIRDLLGSPS